LFLSAFLLFVVQPMVAKMIVPKFGGTPAVWNTCMVFFQAALLAGYAYAHATTKWLGSRGQSLLHLLVLFLPFLALPIAVGSAVPSGDIYPGLEVLRLLVVTVGLPFFVVSTSAPLLQNWFAGTGHPSGKDPYFLYAASNLGSMLALLGYIVLVEPNLKLTQQSNSWLAGYGLLGILTIACALALWRSPRHPVTPLPERPVSALGSSELTPTRRLRWVALAFVPSSLMLGVTTSMSTDIAAVPLLWVIPLALYLLSFILVFSRLPSWVHLIFVILMPIVILIFAFQRASGLDAPVRWVDTTGIGKIVWLFLLQLTAFFFVAMYCHGELAQDRPATKYLTEFYLWMSLGGVLGGLFNALVAPLVFKTAAEYPLVLV